MRWKSFSVKDYREYADKKITSVVKIRLMLFFCLFLFKSCIVCHHLFSSGFIKRNFQQHIAAHWGNGKNCTCTEWFVADGIAHIVINIALLSCIACLAKFMSAVWRLPCRADFAWRCIWRTAPCARWKTGVSRSCLLYTSDAADEL